MVTAPPARQQWASLDGELGDVASVRRSVGDWLRGWGLEPLVDDVELVASELITNAILHAGGHIDVVLERLPLARFGVRVVDVVGERPGHLAILIVAVRPQPLLALAPVLLAQLVGVEANHSGVLSRAIGPSPAGASSECGLGGAGRRGST